MSPSCFIKLLFGAAALSVAGFFAQPFIGLEGAPAGSLFATGLFIGTLVGSVVTALYPSSGQSQAESKGGETTTLYVGNLPFSAKKEEVEDLFRPYGTVQEVRLVTGGPKRRPKGYGFVEMDPRGAKEALKLNGVDMDGRKLRINEAKDKNEE